VSGLFLDFDPLTGTIERFHFDEAARKFTITRHPRDVEPIIDRNKRLSFATDGKTPGGGIHVASIPIEVQMLWLQKHGVRLWDKNHWPGVKRLLNSDEYRYLRINHMIL